MRERIKKLRRKKEEMAKITFILKGAKLRYCTTSKNKIQIEKVC